MSSSGLSTALSVGNIIGIVIGGLAGIATIICVVAMVWQLCCKKQNPAQVGAQPYPPQQSYPPQQTYPSQQTYPPRDPYGQPTYMQQYPYQYQYDSRQGGGVPPPIYQQQNPAMVSVEKV